MTQRLTTCTFCGTGCGLYLETKGNKVTGAYPSMSHPTSQGKLCVRGWNVYEVASSPDRLKSPLIKKNGRFEEVTWAEATGFMAGTKAGSFTATAAAITAQITSQAAKSLR